MKACDLCGRPGCVPPTPRKRERDLERALEGLLANFPTCLERGCNRVAVCGWPSVTTTHLVEPLYCEAHADAAMGWIERQSDTWHWSASASAAVAAEKVLGRDATEKPAKRG